MKTYTGFEYLLIDVANNSPFGLDKLTFEERIKWAQGRLFDLEEIADVEEPWKERPLFIKAVQAIRKAMAGEPTGHLVGLDAVCSGMQIMSALTGCTDGANATGLVDPTRRADAYTDCTSLMSAILGRHLDNQRARVKNAMMTYLYGSVKEPEKEFPDKPELAAFYQAVQMLAPGAVALLDILIKSWDPTTEYHSWVLPDGFKAQIPVVEKFKSRIQIDELNNARFTYQYYAIASQKKGVKNAANVVHSVDAYVLRSLVRRCNYDEDRTKALYDLIEIELLERSLDGRGPKSAQGTAELDYYIERYQATGMVDIVILPYLDEGTLQYLETAHLKGLTAIMSTMLEHPPFEVVTVHDDFKAHPNHLNHLRAHYRNILAELAGSRTLDDILSALFHQTVSFPKKDPTLPEKILSSAYAIC